VPFTIRVLEPNGTPAVGATALAIIPGLGSIATSIAPTDLNGYCQLTEISSTYYNYIINLGLWFYANTFTEHGAVSLQSLEQTSAQIILDGSIVPTPGFITYDVIVNPPVGGDSLTTTNPPAGHYTGNNVFNLIAINSSSYVIDYFILKDLTNDTTQKYIQNQMSFNGGPYELTPYFKLAPQSKAAVDSIVIKDVQTGASTTVYPGGQAALIPIGHQAMIRVNIKNVGTVAGNIWVQATDQNGNYIMSKQSSSVPAGSIQPIDATFYPVSDLSLTIKVGH
jgi:hypothetical protein